MIIYLRLGDNQFQKTKSKIKQIYCKRLNSSNLSFQSLQMILLSPGTMDRFPSI